MQTPAFRPASAWQHDGAPRPVPTVTLPSILPGVMLVVATLLPLATGIVVTATFGDASAAGIVATIVTYSAPAAALAIVVGIGGRSPAMTATASIVAAIAAAAMLVLALVGVLRVVDAVVAVALLGAAVAGFLGLRTLTHDRSTRPLGSWIGALAATAVLLGTTLVAPFLLSGLHPTTLAYVALAAPVTILGFVAAATITSGGTLRIVAIVALGLLAIALAIGAVVGVATASALVVTVLRVALLVAAAILLVRAIGR